MGWDKVDVVQAYMSLDRPVLQYQPEFYYIEIRTNMKRQIDSEDPRALGLEAASGQAGGSVELERDPRPAGER